MAIAAVAMAPDASWAVTVSAEGTVQTWGAGGPARVIHWAVPIDGSQPVAVARAGDRIRVLWADGAAIRLHENVRGARPRDAECGLPAPVRALAMSPSGVLAAVACAGVTLRAVATSLKMNIEGGTVTAEGDLDFRGTLAVSKEAPVGFRSIRLAFQLDTDASEEQVQTLVRLTERYCVVYQTLANPAGLSVSAST